MPRFNQFLTRDFYHAVPRFNQGLTWFNIRDFWSGNSNHLVIS